MPIKAIRHIRKMRGGAQAHLVEADDGHFYVVKFLNNAQHRRIVVNEAVSSMLLEALGVPTPAWAFVEVPRKLAAEHPEMAVELGRDRQPPADGWHFGSRYPGDPSLLAVYDFLPDTLLPKIANLPDFLGALVFDKWTGNADARQAIFFRARVREWNRDEPIHPRKLGFVSVMIDHGFAFNGPHWEFVDSPLQGLYLRKQVYGPVRSLDDFQPWLDRALNFPEEFLDRAWRRIPPAWIAGDEERFERLLERLWQRRRRVPDLIAEMRESRANPFPNWR